MVSGNREIIYEESAETLFDPLKANTLQLEERLQKSGLSSAKPIGYKGLPPGTVGIRSGIKKETVLVRSENNSETYVVYGAATAGKSMERLIKKIAGHK